MQETSLFVSFFVFMRAQFSEMSLQKVLYPQVKVSPLDCCRLIIDLRQYVTVSNQMDKSTNKDMASILVVLDAENKNNFCNKQSDEN